jgi:hypothetical protein
MECSKYHCPHYRPCYILCGIILLKLVVVKIEVRHDKVSEAVHLEKCERYHESDNPLVLIRQQYLLTLCIEKHLE